MHFLLFCLFLIHSSECAPDTSSRMDDGLVWGIDQPGGLEIWDSAEMCGDIKYVRPFLPGSDWRQIGSSAQKPGEDLSIWIFREVNEPTDGNPMLDSVLAWEFIGDNRADDDPDAAPASFWRAHCRLGYSSLGDVVCPESHNPDQVCADAAANTSCVHFTATEPCRYGEKIHECANANNGGYDMSAWEIIADGPVDVIDGYFGTNRLLDATPILEARCVRRDAFADITRQMAQRFN